jgi:Na+/H+ antiporter NhaD/arsenite permease-like protein
VEPGLWVFALTYVLISARRLGRITLDRPSGALIGAVLTVATGALAPRAALAAIDGNTILLLLGMMGLGSALAADGFLDRVAHLLARRCRTPAALLGVIVWGSGALAALVTNDAVCVLSAPLVVALIQRCKLSPAPFLLALATGSNTGSVATLVGNPQNMLCANLGELEYLDHLLRLLPVAVAALALNHGLLHWMHRAQLSGELQDPLETPPAPGRVLTPGSSGVLAILAATVVLYSAGTDLAWTAAAGLAAVILLSPRSSAAIWSGIDGSILVFFAGLFVAVQGLVESGAVAQLLERWPLFPEGTPGVWWRASTIFLIGSNVVSNVPFILVVREAMASAPDPELAWELLAMASTFAGNLTLLGSVANVIVAERGRAVGGLGFLQYLRVGFPLALASTALGTAWLLLLSRG